MGGGRLHADGEGDGDCGKVVVGHGDVDTVRV